MADAPCHIINSAQFKVSLAPDADDLNAPTQLSDFFQRIIQPALDDSLTNYADETQEYRLERLVIDLGQIDIVHPDPASLEKIRLCVARALQDLEPRQLQPVAPGQRLDGSFLEFLQSGQLPWFADQLSISTLETKLQELSATELEPLLEPLRLLLRQRDIRRRLIEQCRLKFIDWLVTRLQPDLLSAFSNLTPEVRPRLAAAEQAEVLLRVAGRAPLDSSKATLAEDLLQQLTENSAASRTREGEQGRPEQAASRTDSTVEKSAERAVEVEKSFFVPQAGVVLLHPFLPRFFTKRGLLDAGQNFLDPSCREKAIHLLHFLATGEEQPEEPQTGLYKILCGLDIHTPVAKNLKLEPEDRDEALLLLNSAIENWSRLKNTSIDGLRSAFLQRQGKLTRTAEGWRLTVEQQAIDILLGTLPWNLAVIRLPWLKQPLQVDWA